ncbi:hypothetical protein ACDF64_17165 [Agromyces sp. MMS24-JH15]|uniref:hypothetical protein n=1 Tax=Agromyces sp. MMS24-JH15 TaxID=3243765 RepID=UPI003749AAD9
MPRPRASHPAIAVAALLAALLAGCAPTASPSEPVDPAGLADITVSVGQGRVDVAGGRIFVLVENGRDEPITVRSLKVRTAGFEPGIADDDPTDFPAGRAIAIRLAPTDAICDAAPDPITVELDVVSEAGSARGELPADDAYGALARIHDQACLGEAVAGIAAITLPDHLRSTGSGADRRAVIDVAIAPAGSGAGSFRIDLVSGTTLIQAEGAHDWVLDLDVAADDPPSTLELAVAPNRCDAHAVAEDKVGSILPFDVTTSDGLSGTVPFAASTTLRSELYAYYAERCGLPTG